MYTGVEISGKKLGLVGLGPIAARVAEIARCCDISVLCGTRNPSPERAQRHEVKFVSLETLFRESDIVSIQYTWSSRNKEINKR